MAYDRGLAQRVREALEDQSGATEKRMFGGIAILVNGNMACGILNDDLIVRVGPDSYVDMLKEGHARRFDITGRPMKGWVMVSREGLDSDEDLQKWLKRGVSYAQTLPSR